MIPTKKPECLRILQPGTPLFMLQKVRTPVNWSKTKLIHSKAFASILGTIFCEKLPCQANMWHMQPTTSRQNFPQKSTTNSSSRRTFFPSSHQSSENQKAVNRQQHRFTIFIQLYMPVTLRHGNKYISSYHFVNNGRNDSCILESTADYLELE